MGVLLRLVCASQRLVASTCVLWEMDKVQTGNFANSLVFVRLQMCPVFLALRDLDGE